MKIPVELRDTYPYTSEREIREKVISVCSRRSDLVTATAAKSIGADKDALKHALTRPDQADIIEKWIERHIRDARRRKVLMSEQQLLDWRQGRDLKVGDTCKYIGESRNESPNGKTTVPRHYGQLGFIISIEEERGLSVYTFRPEKPVRDLEDTDDYFCDYICLERTAGWLNLERVPTTDTAVAIKRSK